MKLKIHTVVTQDFKKPKVIAVTGHITEVQKVFIRCGKAKRKGRKGKGSMYLSLHFSHSITNFLSYATLMGDTFEAVIQFLQRICQMVGVICNF